MAEPSLTRASATLAWAVLAAVVTVGVLAYANTFSNDFVWDDASSVLLNKHVQDPTEFGQLFREDQHPFGRGAGNFYRPLVAASFMADFLASYSAPPADFPERSAADVSPFLFHVTNLTWHLLAAAFLLAILVRLRASVWVCAFVPLFYVVHPLHTEAVTYISGRADPMAAALGFAGVWLALRDDTSPQRLMGLLAGTILFTAGLLCKESAMIFPFLLAMFAILRPVEAVSKRRVYLLRALLVALWLLVLAVYASLRTTVLHFASSPPPPSSLGQRLIECGQSFAWYWKLILVPTGLHMERSLADTPTFVAIIGAVLLLGMLVGFALALRHGRRLIALGIGWFLISWFPISGLIPLNAPMAEHWMYVPLAGFLWAAADTIAACTPQTRQRAAVCAAACALLLVFTTVTVARNKDWRDNESLFRDTLAKNPKSSRVHFNLAITYQDILKNMPGAQRHYEAVIALYKEKKGPLKPGGTESFWDEELESHLSLGHILADRHDYEKAAQHYETILRITPDPQHKEMVADAALQMGQIAIERGNVKAAIEFFKKALAAKPELRESIERMTAKPAKS